MGMVERSADASLRRCLAISPSDQAVLRRWANAAQASAVLVQRAKILLLAAEGVANSEIGAAGSLSPNGDRLAQALGD
jgi:hypothetical protein